MDVSERQPPSAILISPSPERSGRAHSNWLQVPCQPLPFTGGWRGTCVGLCARTKWLRVAYPDAAGVVVERRRRRRRASDLVSTQQSCVPDFSLPAAEAAKAGVGHGLHTATGGVSDFSLPAAEAAKAGFGQGLHTATGGVSDFSLLAAEAAKAGVGQGLHTAKLCV
jgi:hypothetical protein